MNALLVLALVAGMNVLSGSLLIYAATLNMRAARLNRQVTELLRQRAAPDGGNGFPNIP